MAECVVCGTSTTYRFYLCAKCEKEYGRRKKEWPLWLRFLVQQAWRERKREERGYYDREICFSDYPEIDNMASSDVIC